jgi:hypothetical protein
MPFNWIAGDEIISHVTDLQSVGFGSSATDMRFVSSATSLWRQPLQCKAKHFLQTSLLKPEKQSHTLNSIFSNCDLLRFDTAWSYRWMSSSQSNMLHPSWWMKCVRHELVVLYIQVAKPISRPTHFNPEDGRRIFFRNFDVCLKDYTESKPKIP